MKEKKDFVKITFDDIISAREFFDNEEQLKDFLYHVCQYYMGENITHLNDLERGYFSAYKKTMDFIIQAKASGLKGSAVKHKNENPTNTLKGSYKGSSSTLVTNKKIEISNKKEVNNKESNMPINFDKLISFINSSFGRKFHPINKQTKSKFIARIKEGYTPEDIKNTILNLVQSDYHKENNYQYCTPEFISRSSTLEKYATKSTIKADTNTNDEYYNNVMRKLNAL